LQVSQVPSAFITFLSSEGLQGKPQHATVNL